MKKRFSLARLLATLVVICLTAALLCIPAFADTTDPVTVTANGGATEQVDYEGNVTVTGDNVAAVVAEVDTGHYSEATANITGDVSVDGECSTAALADCTGSNSTATVNIEGDVSVTGTGSCAASALATLDTNCTAEVNITGDVSSQDNGSMTVVANAYGISGNSANVNIAGDVTQTGSGAAAVYVNVGNMCSSEVHVDGNVSSSSAGLELNAGGIGSATATVTGDVTADAIGVRMEGAAGLEVVEVGGDVGGGDIGVQMWYGCSKDVLVEGTISGSMYAVVASEVTEDLVNLTTWSIDGEIHGSDNFIENRIHYIVKRADGDAGQGFATTAEDGSALTQYHGFDTAQEGQVVVITPEAGKKILDAYNGSVKLTADANGVFSFIVERGGGILLSVSFEDVPAVPSGTPLKLVKVVFDLGGGTLDGESSLEMVCALGQKIVLPEPVREGYKFVGWETTIRGKTVVLQAGEKFTISDGKTLTALWEEA